MKKLLTILIINSATFLISSGFVLFSNINKNYEINYNMSNSLVDHKLEGSGIWKKLTRIGYYRDGKNIRIKTIPPTVTEIAAQLPSEINSLKNAFVGNRQNVKWTVAWDTSNITDMSGVFINNGYINDPSIKNWNTSKVTDMSKMFYGTKSFNQDISKWDVSKVTNFEEMFNKAEGFSHNLQEWNVSPNVKNNKFGLDKTKQPKWTFIEPEKPINNTPLSRIDNEVLKENEIPNNDHKISKQPTDNLYKIPSARTNTIKSSKSSNTGAIVGSVLGTFTILGAGAGVGYYYRSPLKNSFLKSKDWIKDKLSKIKSK
ncbi:BspA family leucine-rich repeat surface protein [Mycoplasma feriruminatoris]|uniref:BspA family leucine-rich repeat surface protein n=1 Tax=Mycoplasma feriruminatoris TaxID=1179777 RepID=UPI00242044C6|nr:BspA family leucine-rich repeat surface protein [Mycoplasma feriruminatoris]WFQ89932.1 hypothetical protein MFERI11561_00166 [Mycoplasma feriruminatoris]